MNRREVKTGGIKPIEHAYTKSLLRSLSGPNIAVEQIKKDYSSPPGGSFCVVIFNVDHATLPSDAPQDSLGMAEAGIRLREMMESLTGISPFSATADGKSFTFIYPPTQFTRIKESLQRYDEKLQELLNAPQRNYARINDYFNPIPQGSKDKDSDIFHVRDFTMYNLHLDLSGVTNPKNGKITLSLTTDTAHSGRYGTVFPRKYYKDFPAPEYRDTGKLSTSSALLARLARIFTENGLEIPDNGAYCLDIPLTPANLKAIFDLQPKKSTRERALFATATDPSHRPILSAIQKISDYLEEIETSYAKDPYALPAENLPLGELPVVRTGTQFAPPWKLGGNMVQEREALVDWNTKQKIRTTLKENLRYETDIDAVLRDIVDIVAMHPRDKPQDPGEPLPPIGDTPVPLSMAGQEKLIALITPEVRPGDDPLFCIRSVISHLQSSPGEDRSRSR